MNGGLTSINVTGDTNAVFQNVINGGAVAAATTVVILTGQTFSDATAVASALENGGTYDVKVAGTLGANHSAHLIIAYQDLSGNTHLADLAIVANRGATNDIQDMDVRVSTWFN